MASRPCSPHAFSMQQPAESLPQGATGSFRGGSGSLYLSALLCFMTSAEMALCQKRPWPQALWKFSPNSLPRLHPYSQRDSQGVAPCPPPSGEQALGGVGCGVGDTKRNNSPSQMKPVSGERGQAVERDRGSLCYVFLGYIHFSFPVADSAEDAIWHRQSHVGSGRREDCLTPRFRAQSF